MVAARCFIRYRACAKWLTRHFAADAPTPAKETGAGWELDHVSELAAAHPCPELRSWLYMPCTRSARRDFASERSDRPGCP